jgi:hypothetical protein
MAPEIRCIQPIWYKDPEGIIRTRLCGLVVTLLDKTPFVLQSSDGPIEHLSTECARNHFLRCPTESFVLAAPIIAAQTSPIPQRT